MKLVVFGLTVSSSWGNGHATLWRGLIRALSRLGCEVTFFERDVAYYAGHRDLSELPRGELMLYPDWQSVQARAASAVAEADAAMVTSYCPDAQAASDLVRDAAATSVFYDMDSPVTLARLEAGEPVAYLPRGGFAGFDLVLSWAAGPALGKLEALGARCARPLLGHVVRQAHRALPREPLFRADLS
jgi:spore maturation protein CgeB